MPVSMTRRWRLGPLLSTVGPDEYSFRGASLVLVLHPCQPHVSALTADCGSCSLSEFGVVDGSTVGVDLQTLCLVTWLVLGVLCPSLAVYMPLTAVAIDGLGKVSSNVREFSSAASAPACWASVQVCEGETALLAPRVKRLRRGSALTTRVKHIRNILHISETFPLSVGWSVLDHRPTEPLILRQAVGGVWWTEEPGCTASNGVCWDGIFQTHKIVYEEKHFYEPLQDKIKSKDGFKFSIKTVRTKLKLLE
jgi:hypothetical protein